MQLGFTELGGDSGDSGLPAMAPFAMRSEGIVYNRGTTRGSGVLESGHAAPVAREPPRQEQREPPRLEQREPPREQREPPPRLEPPRLEPRPQAAQAALGLAAGLPALEWVPHGVAVAGEVDVDRVRLFAGEFGWFFIGDTLQKRFGDVWGADVPSSKNRCADQQLL